MLSITIFVSLVQHCSEFSSACKAYTEYAMYHYRRKQLSEARALLARGNSRLPERKS